MRIAGLLLIVALAAGCGHNSAVAVGAGTPPPAPGTPPGTASITSSGAAALGLILIFGTMDYVNNPRPLPNPADLVSPAPQRAPELATGRRISEQDCTKPVDLTLGNLRCK